MQLDAEWRRSSNRVHEVTTHISIHTIHLDGLRELYRHFLRLDNGAIIEVSWERKRVLYVAMRELSN